VTKSWEKKELFLARFAAGAAVLVAGYFGVNPPGFVAATVALAFGLAASSFFPAIVLGIFDKRMNKQGAIAGMVTGISLMLFYMIYFKLGWFTQTIPPSTDWWWDISPEGFGTVGMLVNIFVALVVSRWTTPPPAHIQQLTESIRYPRRTA
jgi:cation/acetate symporter